MESESSDLQRVPHDAQPLAAQTTFIPPPAPMSGAHFEHASSAPDFSNYLENLDEVRSVLDRWSFENRSFFRRSGLGSMATIRGREVETAHVIRLTTFFEKRTVERRRDPYRGEAFSRGSIKDKWAPTVPLPEPPQAKRHEFVVPGSESVSTCDACNGARQTRCDPCYGEGRVDCKKCQAHGRVACGNCARGLAKCMTCDGSGRSGYGAQASRCGSCGGAGQGQCGSCGGSGERICSSCRGKRKLDCQSCSATGKITCSGCAGAGRVKLWQALIVEFVVQQDVVAGGPPELQGEMPEASGVQWFFRQAKALATAFPELPEALGMQVGQMIAAISGPSGSICVHRQTITITDVPLANVTYSLGKRSGERCLYIFGNEHRVHGEKAIGALIDWSAVHVLVAAAATLAWAAAWFVLSAPRFGALIGVGALNLLGAGVVCGARKWKQRRASTTGGRVLPSRGWRTAGIAVSVAVLLLHAVAAAGLTNRQARLAFALLGLKGTAPEPKIVVPEGLQGSLVDCFRNHGDMKELDGHSIKTAAELQVDDQGRVLRVDLADKQRAETPLGACWIAALRKQVYPGTDEGVVAVRIEVGTEAVPPSSRKAVASRFERLSCGGVHDAKTGLTWYIGPDKDLTFDEARGWAEALGVCGATWRLPDLEELAALYDPQSAASTGHVERGKTWPPHLDVVFAGIGGGSWVWASDPATTPSAASSFNFNLGKRVSYSANSLRYSTRAFAVRVDGPSGRSVPSSTGASEPAEPSISVAEATTFATAYFDEVARDDVDTLTTHFADRVDWYSKGIVTREVVERDQRKYHQRWPEVHFSVDGTVEVRPAMNGATIAIVPVIFDETDTRGHRVSGRATNYWTLVRTEGGIRIAAEDQKLLSRDSPDSNTVIRPAAAESTPEGHVPNGVVTEGIQRAQQNESNETNSEGGDGQDEGVPRPGKM